MLDEDLTIDEILIAGSTHYKSKRNITTTDTLSKTWNVSQEDEQLTIDNATQRCVTQVDLSMKIYYSTNDRLLRHKRLDEYFCMYAFYTKNLNQ